MGKKLRLCVNLEKLSLLWYPSRHSDRDDNFDEDSVDRDLIRLTKLRELSFPVEPIACLPFIGQIWQGSCPQTVHILSRVHDRPGDKLRNWFNFMSTGSPETITAIRAVKYFHISAECCDRLQAMLDTPFVAAIRKSQGGRVFFDELVVKLCASIDSDIIKLVLPSFDICSYAHKSSLEIEIEVMRYPEDDRAACLDMTNQMTAFMQDISQIPRGTFDEISVNLDWWTYPKDSVLGHIVPAQLSSQLDYDSELQRFNSAKNENETRVRECIGGLYNECEQWVRPCFELSTDDQIAKMGVRKLDISFEVMFRQWDGDGILEDMENEWTAPDRDCAQWKKETVKGRVEYVNAMLFQAD